MANDSRNSRLDKPMSVEQIVQLAGAQPVDPQYFMQHYFRTANLLIKQANIYEHEGNDQMAYFLLYRHATLILDSLSRHPHAKDSEYKQAWAEARQHVKTNLAKLETLKPKINIRNERYRERKKARAAETQASPRMGSGVGSIGEGVRRMSLDMDGQRGQSPARLDALEHRTMAVDMANKEIERRMGRSTDESRDDGDISASLINARRNVDRPIDAEASAQRSLRRTSPMKSSFRYPSVPEGDKRKSGERLSLPTFNSIKYQPPQAAPTRSPKDRKYFDHVSNSPPPVPSKMISPPPLPSKTPAAPPTHQFASSSTLENGTPLRTIFLPQPLRNTFLHHASPNTRANLETLGLLCGTLIRNALFITKLVLPAQTSTSDTCEMIAEDTLHAYIDAQPEDLMVLGWIHTHPSQTCFMSSRDLHTHVWYQVSMPESIAVVCAPGQRQGEDWGVFRLTDPPGVGVVRRCEKVGVFHPHDVPPGGGGLYTDCVGRPGHVIEVEGLGFEVVDLRDPVDGD